MKVYTGKLKPETELLVKDNEQFFSQVLSKKSKGLGKVSSKVYSLKESIEKHNAGISQDEINAWIWYRKKKGVPMKNWDEFYDEPSKKQLIDYVKRGILFQEDNNGSLVPYPVYAFGNVYSKIKQVEKAAESIISNYGQSVYDNHLNVLKGLIPKMISITNTSEKERPVILSISSTAQEFEIESLKDTPLSERMSLQSAYIEWLRGLPDDAFKKTRAFEIINYYLYKQSKPQRLDKIEWRSIKKITREEGERLFKVFLHTALEYNDQVRIDEQYNREFNATAALQHHKIPVALQVSKSFNGFPLSIREAQREGIAFMELVGSGIVAYDVGVGKTITAIIELANAINSGKCKRPIVAVPNPTYKNWIAEFIGKDGNAGILSGTGITINEWYNLGTGYSKINLGAKVPEKSITLVTYEGLEKIGFNQNTASEHFSELAAIVSQNDEDKTERANEQDNEKLREIIGVGNKETIADIETLGFDYVVVDEAHNFKNVFSEVKSDKNGNKHFHVKGGKPSNRGIKLFFLCNYIQRVYGRNVMLLTATPFTNSPLEIYSMLSFVAHDYMKSWGIYNIRIFFEQYISETSEYVVGIDGEISEKNVVKSFNNRISLQKLINSHINFKTGEEANIPRPCKVNLPKTTVLTDKGLVKLKKEDQVLTYLTPTPRQRANQLSINDDARSGHDSDDPGKLLRLMSQSLNNALSPFLYGNDEPLDYFDFVEESPKIKYVIECMRSVKKWHEDRNEEVSGQVMYIDRGKDYFPYIKEYLERELGYKKDVKLISNPRQKVDEVEIITSGISQSNKEKIKAAFNEGTCKVIIGTSTIKEGINLQEKSTCLYNLYPNWNPTDIRQLEGRIWRQKNENGFVRITMPLMENSMDIFVFQKLEEKTSRINDLWSKSDRGNVLDEESLDTNEVKFALVTDLEVLMRFELKQLESDLESKKVVLSNNYKDLDDYSHLKYKLEELRTHFYNRLTKYISEFKGIQMGAYGEPRLLFGEIGMVDVTQYSKEFQRKIERYQKIYDMLFNLNQNFEDKDMIVAMGQYGRYIIGLRDWKLEEYKEVVSKYAKIRRTIFEQRGYSESTDVSTIKGDIQKELLMVTKELEDLKTPEFQERLLDKIRAEKAKLAIKGGALKDRVRDFASLNYLMSWKFTDVDHSMCEIPKSENTKSAKQVNKNVIDSAKKIKLAKAKIKIMKMKLALLSL